VTRLLPLSAGLEKSCEPAGNILFGRSRNGMAFFEEVCQINLKSQSRNWVPWRNGFEHVIKGYRNSLLSNRRADNDQTGLPIRP
jgi:hypothetical protein